MTEFEGENKPKGIIGRDYLKLLENKISPENYFEEITSPEYFGIICEETDIITKSANLTKERIMQTLDNLYDVEFNLNDITKSPTTNKEII